MIVMVLLPILAMENVAVVVADSPATPSVIAANAIVGGERERKGA